MSFFSNLFGGKNESKRPTTGEAIHKLREMEEMLVKKQEFLEAKIELEIDIAKKNAVKNKRVAIKALKRKKQYGKQLEQIDGTLSTIELQRYALEGANTNTAVLTTMKEAANALKEAHKHMDVDQVHDMMDEIAEQQDVSKEISEAISNPMAFDVDEEDLEKELEELEQESLENDLLKVVPENLPAVPQVEIVKPRPTPAIRKFDDDDMNELEAWAS